MVDVSVRYDDLPDGELMFRKDREDARNFVTRVDDNRLVRLFVAEGLCSCTEEARRGRSRES